MMIDEKIKQITDHFLYDLDKDNRHKSFSLLSGRSGTILFFVELFKNSGNDLYKQHIIQNLEFVYNKIDSADHLVSTYCDGLAGWGWLIEHLKEEKLLQDEYDSILEDIDDLLTDQINELIKQKNFDLLHGLLGLGIYFIKRKNTRASEQIILSLADNCKEENGEVRFSRHNPYNLNDEIYDLGLPHGMAGILYFVSKCYKANIQPELCKELLSGFMNFYFNNIQKSSSENSYYANRYLVKDYKSGLNNEVRSRLAWCYGDLTILYSLYGVSELLDLETEKSTIVDMLINLCKRKLLQETSVSDATFCHGSTGVAYLFLKLHKKTFLEIFNDTANYWLKETLNYGNQNGFGGYLFEVSSTREFQLTAASGLLEGIGGVGLVLSAFQNKDSDNAWDECFFLS